MVLLVTKPPYPTPRGTTWFLFVDRLDGFAGDCISPNGGIKGEQEAGPGRAGPPVGFIRDFSAKVPLGHMGRDGKDLGGAALFLAAPASDYVTGITLPVDGGFSIWH